MSSPAALPTTSLRPAREADWDAVRHLLEANRLPLAGARERLADFVLAERDGRLVGCAGLELHGDAALLRSVAVDPAAQGQGLGDRLVRAMLDAAARRGLPAVWLLTTTAADWFPRFGFQRLPRESAPPALGASAEFRGACPASAVLMACRIG